ncbi:glucoamylase family protein [Jatrophihabitans fulvus]
MRRLVVVLSVLLLTAGLVTPASAAPPRSDRALLQQIARDTWRFFEADVDPRTHLPLDNLGPGGVRGEYTSAANIGVYLWAVVAARDLNVISTRQAEQRVTQILRTVARIKRSHGFLYQWYDTSTGDVISKQDGVDCATQTAPAQNNCFFLSAVDNGWYASGLVVARQALRGVAPLATRLLRATDFSIFYDDGPQTDCVANTGGQQYGGYYVGQGPAGYHNSALYSDPRMAMYLGMGLRQMPGDVWWRSWRTQPPVRCAGDPSDAGQGQPSRGRYVTVRDPRSGQPFRVWQGYYVDPDTGRRFLPTFAGGMFEALMANLVVPESTWGRHSFGLADRRTVDVQRAYATRQLGFPVWGLSPSSTPDDTGGYGIYGVGGQRLPVGDQLAQCPTCPVETAVTPHASFLALDAAPRAAIANIRTMLARYPGVYSRDGGFYDGLDPVTGSVGHRRLVLDQSMIMAALANALDGRSLQRWFARDPVSWAAKAYLRAERMPL